MSTLRDEIAALMHGAEADITADDQTTVMLCRALLELMDNRPAPVRIKLIRSATKEQNEGWEFSADSNATDEDTMNALKQAAKARKELIREVDFPPAING